MFRIVEKAVFADGWMFVLDGLLGVRGVAEAFGLLQEFFDREPLIVAAFTVDQPALRVGAVDDTKELVL